MYLKSLNKKDIQLTKTLRDHFNNKSRPLIFLGSSVALYKQLEVCENFGITVHGIIDQDYYGNTEHLCDLPVIDGQDCFRNPEKLNFYRDNFNFFCATNWTPEPTSVLVRNREKRKVLIDLIDQYDLPCISIVDPRARISKYATVGQGCFIDGDVMIEHHVTIKDYVNIYCNNDIGHGSTIGRNCVIQRQGMLAADSVLEDDVFMAMRVTALKQGARYGTGSFVQEGIYLRRGTVPGEVVGLKTENPSRVVGQIIE